jgi:EGF domain
MFADRNEMPRAGSAPRRRSIWSTFPILLLLLFFDFLQRQSAAHPVPFPAPGPQVIVRSQSLLYPQQPGRQVDLTHVLPTTELFWLNIEEGYFACQVNSSEKYLKIFRLSRLCDGIVDCFEGSDELGDALKCSRGCSPPNCNTHGACLASTPEAQCHCDDGFGGKSCEMSDVNECRQGPCSVYAECTNTLGSFFCTCRVGYVGDGFECEPIRDSQGGIVAAPLTTTVARKNGTAEISDASEASAVTTVTVRTFTTKDQVEGTASSAILDGHDETLLNEANQKLETTPQSVRDNQQSSDTAAVTREGEPTTTKRPSSAVADEASLDDEKNQNSVSPVGDQIISTTQPAPGPELPPGETGAAATVLPEDVEPVSTGTNATTAKTVISNNQDGSPSKTDGSDQDETTAPPAGNLGNLPGFQIPNTIDDVLSNVKLAVDGFIRHHQVSVLSNILALSVTNRQSKLER